MAIKTKQLSKEELFKYVADVTSMEQAIFTLNETSKAYKNQVSDANANVAEIQNNIANTQKSLNKAKNKLKNSRLGIADYISGILLFTIKHILLFIFGLPILTIVVSLLFVDIAAQNMYFVYAVVIAIVIIWCIIAVFNTKKSSPKTEDQKWIRVEISEYEEALFNYKEALNNFEEYEISNKEAWLSEATRCASSAAEIRKNLDTLYAMNVIPQDYRTFDTLLCLNQIFRNDLADTIREAIELYEERVYRGEVVKGIQNIYSRLKEMNSSMDYITNELRKVEQDVNSMTRDMHKVSGKLSSGAASSDSMLSELRSFQYAFEQINASRERCKEYLDQD